MQVQAVVARGVDASECLSTSGTGCGPVTMQIQRHRTEDLALLKASSSLVPSKSVPELLVRGDFDQFQVAGFGVGALERPTDGPALAGTRLQVRRMRVARLTTRYVIAKASAASRVCEGDSGAPAILLSSVGAPTVAAMLYSSSGRASCTPVGGDQVFVRLGPLLPFIETALGRCTRYTRSGLVVARC